VVSKLTTIDISPSIFIPQGEVFLNSSLLHQERKIFTPRRCESLLYFNYSLVGQKLAEEDFALFSINFALSKTQKSVPSRLATIEFMSMPKGNRQEIELG
jgi:hypothetical protein